MIEIICWLCGQVIQGIRGITRKRLPMSKLPWKTMLAVRQFLPRLFMPSRKYRPADQWACMVRCSKVT